jgi:uracil-DNA glycosylase
MHTEIQWQDNSAFLGTLYHEFMGLPTELIERQTKLFASQFNFSNYDTEEENLLRQAWEDVRPTTIQGYPGISFGEMSWLGVDLPVGLSVKGAKNDRLMIVAMDPLRSDDGSGSTRSDTITLNTPFTIHNRAINNSYNQQIIALADRYAIYVTDAYKLFFRQSANYCNVSNQMPVFRNNLSLHKAILKKEVEFFDPKFILCLGKQAGQVLASIADVNFFPLGKTRLNEQRNHYFFDDRSFFCVPHASGAARGHAALFMRLNQLPYRSSSYISDVVAGIEGLMYSS